MDYVPIFQDSYVVVTHKIVHALIPLFNVEKCLCSKCDPSNVNNIDIKHVFCKFKAIFQKVHVFFLLYNIP